MPDIALRVMPDVPRNLDKAMWDLLIAMRHNLNILAGFQGAENAAISVSSLGSITAGLPTYVLVSDLDDPSPELASLSSDEIGSLLIAYKSSEYTIYSWVNTLDTVSSPYVVAGNGGRWIAIAGKYTNMDVYMTSGNALYLGPASTNGSWRLKRSGNDLIVERRESGVWTEKTAFLAS